MRTPIIAVALALATTVANATEHLSSTGIGSSGSMEVDGSHQSHVQVDQAFNEDVVISVDASAKRLVIANDEFQIERFFGKSDGTIMLDANQDAKAIGLTFNRSTGRMHSNVTTDLRNGTALTQMSSLVDASGAKPRRLGIRPRRDNRPRHPCL